MPQPRNWHALMNEIQMLWHDHPVNRAREADGLPVVNAAWPWPRPQQAPLPRIASDDALVCWLAGSTPVRDGPLPALNRGRRFRVWPWTRRQR